SDGRAGSPRRRRRRRGRTQSRSRRARRPGGDGSAPATGVPLRGSAPDALPFQVSGEQVGGRAGVVPTCQDRGEALVVRLDGNRAGGTKPLDERGRLL